MIRFQGGPSSPAPRQKTSPVVRFSPTVEYIPHLKNEDRFTHIEDVSLRDLSLQNSDSDSDSDGSYDGDPPPELFYGVSDKKPPKKPNLLKKAIEAIAHHPNLEEPFDQMARETGIPAPALQAATQNILAHCALDSAQRRYQQKVEAFHAAQRHLPLKKQESYSPLRTNSSDYVIKYDPETGRSIRFFKPREKQTP